jgi:hypothetical protein
MSIRDKEKAVRKIAVMLVMALTLLSDSSVRAQCNRRAASSSGSTAPMSASTSLGGTAPFSTLSPIISSRNAGFLAASNRSQIARQRYMLVQQQQYLQTMAARQRELESQLASIQNYRRNGDTITDEETDTPSRARRERLRQQNALKAFQVAEKAEMNNRFSTAERNYKRVIRILGDTDTLGRRAASALAELSNRPAHGEETILTALNK